jgi:hypothetical protein
MYVCTKREIVAEPFLETNCQAKCCLASFQGDLNSRNLITTLDVLQLVIILDDEKWHSKIHENKEMGPLQFHALWWLSNLCVQFMILHITITTSGIL